MSRIFSRTSKSGKPRRGKDGKFKTKRKLFDHGRSKSAGVMKGYKTQYRCVRIGRGGSVEIPIDKKGNVPESAIAAHFLNTTKGDRNGRQRNTTIDQGTNAKVVIKPDKNGMFKPEDIAKWWEHPNEYDIEGIDTVGADPFRVIGVSRKSSAAHHKKIAVFAPTDGDLAQIRKSLDNAFTVRELKSMVEERGLTIEVDPDIKDLGYYDYSNDIIKLHLSSIRSGTTIHEAVHRLRETDKTRNSTAAKTRIPIFTNEDRNLEEAATTAETFIRLDPAADPDYISYYSYLPNPKAAIESDRKKFHGESGKPLKGKRAVASLEKNFENSDIGDLKHKGSKRTAKNYLRFLRKGEKG